MARDLIRENFDPNYKQQSEIIRILISTDILSEGINLHRSNMVINYDLPWNPARVMQRVGRVNRVGTRHKNIHIFNFFPTAASELHLGLEASIKTKIQAFHDTLGEDARYLTDEEELSTHQLFGDALYRKLIDKKSYQGEEEEEKSELEYLHLIRKIRDEQTDLFEKMKRLPKKARTGRKMLSFEQDQLLTFFRKGKLKKFFMTDGLEAKELTFFDAAEMFKCHSETPRETVPKMYFEMLDKNKAQFDLITSGEIIEKTPSRGGLSNEKYIIRRLKAHDIKHFKGYTEDDEEFLRTVLAAFEDGIVPKNTSKRLKKELEREGHPLKVLGTLRRNIPKSLLFGNQATESHAYNPREVILSEYFIP